MNRSSCRLALCATFLLCVSVSTTATEQLSAIVQYQEWFSEYASILEETMQIKRQGNSNATLYFNKELVKLLANATIEMRSIDNTTESAILKADTIDESCRRLALEQFAIYSAKGQADLQECAAYTAGLLDYWTYERFYGIANIVHREATELTHRVGLILEQYNKITQMDNILEVLSEEYYAFNNFNNQFQNALNLELERFNAPNHPLRTALFDCLDMTVTFHQLYMDYVLSYVESACNTQY
uniref:Protein TsetseEP domain-containing protein n=1 Tax=Anopheles coluzzii TaxID=1518534 RepID=A0A6E8W651_ANOCL